MRKVNNMTWKDIIKKDEDDDIDIDSLFGDNYDPRSTDYDDEGGIENKIKDVLGNPTQYEYKMYKQIYEDGKSGEQSEYMSVDEYVEDLLYGSNYTEREAELIRYFYELGLKEKNS